LWIQIFLGAQSESESELSESSDDFFSFLSDAARNSESGALSWRRGALPVFSESDELSESSLSDPSDFRLFSDFFFDLLFGGALNVCEK
jgi:hypothetical protein